MLLEGTFRHSRGAVLAALAISLLCQVRRDSSVCVYSPCAPLHAISLSWLVLWQGAEGFVGGSSPTHGLPGNTRQCVSVSGGAKAGGRVIGGAKAVGRVIARRSLQATSMLADFSVESEVRARGVRCLCRSGNAH